MTNQDVWKEFLDVMDTWCDGAKKEEDTFAVYVLPREKRLILYLAASSFSQDFDDCSLLVKQLRLRSTRTTEFCNESAVAIDISLTL